MIGQVLDGRYRIVGLLGRGGIGIVYRAEQVLVHDRDVAVKVLSAGASVRAITVHRFENEARIIAQLRHPNTLKLIDTGRTPDGRLYIVTECLAGEPLSDRLERGALGALEVLRVLQQIAGALVEAHEKGVVHRDLKPANIFLEDVGSQQVVKVLDFGIAKLVWGASHTAPMQIFGTPGFMAPEQCLGATVDPRTDLYALGVLAYLCLSLEMPTPGVRTEEILAATIDVPATPLHQRLPGVEPELEALVMRLLAKAPEDRLPDAEAVKTACTRLLRNLARTDQVPLPGASMVAPVAWTAEDLEAETAAAEAPTPVDGGLPEAPTPRDDDTQPTPIADAPGDTRILTPKLVATVPAGRSATFEDKVDVAPTLVPPGPTAPEWPEDDGLVTEWAPPPPPPRQKGLRRSVSIAVVSALVAAALAAAAVLLVGR